MARGVTGAIDDATVSVVLSGTSVRPENQARLICAGMPTLVLPWWPDEVENSGWAPDWAETARPGRAPLLTRSTDPLPTMRLSFVLRDSSIDEPMGDLIARIRRLAAATPVVHVMLGQSDRGVWRVTDAGANETDWAANGEPSVADVVISLRAASDATIAVGPVASKPKPKK